MSYRYTSPTLFAGYPLIDIAVGRDADGRRAKARGIVAIGHTGASATLLK
jgi:hypothetical protein